MENKRIIQVDEKVPFKMLVPLSIQHMFAMFGASVLVPFVFGINPAVVLFMNGLGTLLFILITKGRAPAYLGSSFAFLAPAGIVISKWGYSYALGGFVAVGFCGCVLSLIIYKFGSDWIDVVLPPAAMGPVVALIGLELAGTAASNAGLKDEVIDSKNVIVIGRQYGCGGHDIGKKLAEKFGYEFYDQEIIQMIAGTTGMTSEFIRQKEESMTNSLLYDFVNQMYLYGKEEEEAPKDKIFEAESKVIRELAAKGKCVIIGRCSDYVLRENEKTLKLFFTAPLEVRAKRIMERLNISKKEAEQVIRKEDRRRADNYRYYTGRVWGSAANVDLTFNTAMNEKYIEECISKAMELEI